ncbi:unnamed protein product [Candidula unifasciata]|uniref:Protein phosphatase 1 regulatory subunit 35 C-terminal domain-containing protein n=1 Tax=Candidula unifasciata TaxID=100452 RepID=A0A8S4A5M8_9EUPU|nr:unnamed protein product [Candidula unifasciata]
MTLVRRMKSTASAFDRLRNQGHVKSAAGQQPDSTKQDDDPSTKLRTRMQTLESKGVILHEVTNVNNNKTAELTSVRRHVLNQGEVVDDAAHAQHKVPVPLAWSPGMTFKSNPLLMITPEKLPFSANENFLSTKENILEPQSANKIPKPTAWSPGMKIQPDPNLFITPEKTVGKKIIASVSDSRQTTDTVSSSIQNIPAKVKNSYSVRFDLPSSTSEDESKDPLSETDSPITIRGRDLDVQGQSFESPEGKSFSFQKTYNPGIYSDESSLDESILNSRLNCSFDKSYKKQTSLGVTKSLCDNSNVPANVSSVLPNCTSDQNKSPSSEAKPCKSTENFPKTGNMNAHLSVSSTWPQRINPKLKSAKNTRSKDLHDRKKLPVGDKFIAKADHMKSQLSTELAPEGSVVIREMQSHQLSTKYSFPFELTATADDCEYEHVFARPEFNSTLAIRERLDNLQDQEVDVMKAVQDTLAKSEVKRSELNEKAAVYTNRLSGQFKNLVDLNTSVESLCDRIVRMRTSKVPCKRRAANTEKKFSESQRAPDLMEFFTSDLQKEYPDVTLPSVTEVTSQLMTSPPETTFDLYRHNRLWQGISDF